MMIELWVNSEIKKIWLFESQHADIPGEKGYLARRIELLQRVAELKADPQLLIITGYSEKWELFVRVKSRLSCKDVIDDNLLTEK